MKAPLFKLNWRDVAHGLITAIGGAVISGLIEGLGKGQVPTSASDLKTIGITAASAGGAYLLKNVFSNSAGNFAQAESKAPTIVQVPKPEANTDITVEQTITPTIKNQ